MVHLTVRFLDNVIDASRFPLERIDETVRRNRKIGLGVMGFADLLFQLGIPYDSEAGIALAEAASWASSMPKATPPRPVWPKSAGPSRPMRNPSSPSAAKAPTAMPPSPPSRPRAPCPSSAAAPRAWNPCSPFASPCNILDGERLVEVNPYFEAALKEAGLGTPELMEQVVEKGSIQSLDALPAAMRKVFVTAMDIDPVWHLRMQAAFQLPYGQCRVQDREPAPQRHRTGHPRHLLAGLQGRLQGRHRVP